MWELSTGVTTRRFVGHTGDVLSVSFSADNRQIVSGSRDKSIKLWNTLGDCKFTITDKGHTEWVSCVRFSPNPQNPVIVSAGWDKLVKVRDCPSKMITNGEALYDVCFLRICYFRGTIYPSETIFSLKLLIITLHAHSFDIQNFIQAVHLETNVNKISGVGARFLPNPNRPYRTHRIYQYCHHLPRRIPLCFRWQGWHYYALGSQRVQAPLLPQRR